MKKRFLCIIFSLLMLVSLPAVLHSASAEAYSGQCGDNLFWSIDETNRTLVITGSGAMWDYYAVQTEPWFPYSDLIESVQFPQGLTSIGAGAFDGCYLLTSVMIPNGVVSIGDCAFTHCTSLETVVLPNSVKTLGGYAFQGSSVRTVSIPSNTALSRIEVGAFFGCMFLNSFSIPKSVEYIGEAAFAYCEGLTAKTFQIDPNNAQYEIVDGVLYSKDHSILLAYLSSKPQSTFTVPNDVTYIGAYSFSDCENLTSIEIPESVTGINGYAFARCTKLTSIRIPTSLAWINSYTFSQCSRLKSIVLPSTVTKMFEASFYGCDALKDIYYIGTKEMRDGNAVFMDDLEINGLLQNKTWHFVKETYTVTFDSNGGTAVAKQTVRVLDSAKKPSDPTKDGFVFKGWYLGADPYDFSTPVVANMTLKAQWGSCVTFNPDGVQFKGTTPYVVYNGKAQTPGVIVKDKNGKTVAASKYTVTYRNNVNPGTAYADVTMKDTSATSSVWFKIYLPPTVSTTVQNRNDGIQISWKKVDGAKGYVIYRRAWNLVDKGWTTFERWNNTKSTTWIDKKVYAGTRYQYGIKAYFSDPMDNYNLGLVGPLKTTVRITTRTLNSVTPGSRKLTVKWTGSKLFTGCEVQVATDANFTKDVKTATISKEKTYQMVMKGLKKATTYFVRIRSYHIFEGTTYYGGWSNVLTGKTK